MWQDLRRAARSLLRQRRFTVPAVLSLALGIGANVTIFSFIHAIFLRPLPLDEPSRLVSIASRTPENPTPRPISYPNFLDYRDQTRDLFSGLAAARWNGFNLATGDGTYRIFGEFVTAGYLEVLGVEAAAGRLFRPGGEAATNASAEVVLSHGLWRRLFGSDPGVPGRSVRINGVPFTVIGVAEASFRGLDLTRAPEIWVPMTMAEELVSGRAASFFRRRDGRLLNVIGRLRPGVGPTRAEAALVTVARRLEASFPEQNRELGVALEPLAQAALPASQRGKLSQAGGLLMAVVGLLLAIACINVAGLLLGRAVARRRETAVRLALGASRARLFRLLAAEGLVLAFAGGGAALVLAAGFRNLLWGLRPSYLSDGLAPGFNVPVLAFALGLTLAAAVAFSFVPAARSFRLDLVSELKERAGGSGRGGARLRTLLLVIQVALSAIVLSAAGLFTGSLRNLQRIDPGFTTENLFLIPVTVAFLDYGEEEGRELFRRILERMESAGSVAGATFATQPPLSPAGRQSALELEDRGLQEGLDETLIAYNVVSAGYFETLGIDLVEGRTFREADRRGAPPVAVVNRTLARLLDRGGGAVGQRFGLEEEELPVEVVGVVADIKYGGFSEAPRPYFYLPAAQSYSPSSILHVRALGDPAPVAALARREIHALDRNLPLLETRFLSQLVDFALWAPRMIAGLSSFFGALALLLTAVGIYGVISYSVSRRRREIGLRMALGARRRRVVALLMRQGLGTAGLGLAAGLTVALAAAGRVADLLFGMAPRDPATLAAVVLVVLAATVLATALPALRAASVSPSEVLRDE